MRPVNAEFVKWLAHAAAAAALAVLPGAAPAQTLKVVMHSDVKILDPIWTTAYIVRNHGYMVYDTLLAVDDKLAVKPQMLERLEGQRRQAHSTPSPCATA